MRSFFKQSTPEKNTQFKRECGGVETNAYSSEMNSIWHSIIKWSYQSGTLQGHKISVWIFFIDSHEFKQTHSNVYWMKFTVIKFSLCCLCPMNTKSQQWQLAVFSQQISTILLLFYFQWVYENLLFMEQALFCSALFVKWLNNFWLCFGWNFIKIIKVIRSRKLNWN